MSTYTGKIYSKSPYFIVETGDPNFESTAYITIWTGSFDTDRPSTPDFVMSKTPAAASGTELIYEVSQLVRSKFSHNPYAYASFFGTGSQKDAVWVGIETTGSSSPKDNYYLALDGYTDFLRGANYFNETTVPLSLDTIYVPEGKRFGIPVFCNTSGSFRVDLNSDYGLEITIDTYPNVTGSLSQDKLRYISYDDEYSVITNIKVYGIGDVLRKTIYVKRLDCNVNYTNKCIFLNKHGVIQEIWLTGASSKTLNITKNSYNKYLTYVASGNITYDTTKHQSQDINVQATENIIMNTGWVDEQFNIIIKELLLSDYVWITFDSEEIFPAKVVTSTLQYKKDINLSLINYTIEFQVAFDQINSVL